MKILKTRKQVEIEKSTTRRLMLRELNKRGALDSDLKGEYYRLEQGNLGEEVVLDAIAQFGQPHWRVMQNVWLDYFGKFECDLLLMTSETIYVIEVKHYSENFVYLANQCYLNGNKIGHNAISQAIKSAQNFQNMLADTGYRVPVKSGLVFTGEFCDVGIDDQVDHLAIVMRHQLRTFIRKIADDERRHRSPQLDVDKVFRMIEAYESESHFTPNPIREGIYKNISPGILCVHCGSFDMEIFRKKTICLRCGTCEPTENAIVRTICEYGIIYHERDLLTSDLHSFLEGVVSKQTLRKYLKKHFEKKGAKKNSSYINQQQSFKILRKNMELPTQKLQIWSDY